MNHLEVECTEKINEDGSTYYVVEFFIDGQRFADLVHDFEASFSGNAAGDYGPLYYASYGIEFLLGEKPEYHGKTYLLSCSCGIVQCRSIVARIRVQKQQVIWDAFEEPDHDWDYEGFGPFVFDLEQYRNAIARIPRAKT